MTTSEVWVWKFWNFGFSLRTVSIARTAMTASVELISGAADSVLLERNPFPKFPQFPLPERTDGESSLALINTWLSFCKKNHQWCKESQGKGSWRPTRLVDTGDIDSEQRPRVVVTATENVRDMEYLCLSHRWIDTRVKLESTNIHELERSIPVQEVSHTIREAFDTTRRLGFRYIWIDSLCIFQDHQNNAGWQDWLTESSRMGDNYKYAVLTMAPTPAMELADQFFSTRTMTQRSPLAIEIKRKAPQDMAWSVCTPPRADASGIYYCFSEIVWSGQVHQAPLNRRGWVYQERLLSPRTVHFASDVFWECREKVASSMIPMGLFDVRQWVRQDTATAKCWSTMLRSIGSGFLDEYGNWKNLVMNFSRCNLTLDRDKLPAISAIAREMQLPDDQYLAGLWRKGFVSQLVWRRAMRSTKDYKSPVDYRGAYLTATL